MSPVPRRSYLGGALVLCLALPVLATPSPGAAQAQTKIVTGMVAHGPPQWPQYIATELGWLKQDNIELDFITAGGGAPSSSRPARSISAIAATPISRARRCRARR